MVKNYKLPPHHYEGKDKAVYSKALLFNDILDIVATRQNNFLKPSKFERNM